MKSLLALSFFAASAIAGDWGQSCNGEIFDSSTGILTAQCNIGDGKGTFVEAKLDLYHCLKYTNGKISAPGGDGTFGDICKDCTVYRLDDEIYGPFGVTRPWISCTCSGGSEASTLNLDITTITNVYGDLVCSR